MKDADFDALLAKFALKSHFWILDEHHNPVDVGDDVLAWSRSRSHWQRVAETTLPNHYWVSTVFLGLDHNFYDDGPPILFETMTFPCEHFRERTIQ